MTQWMSKERALIALMALLAVLAGKLSCGVAHGQIKLLRQGGSDLPRRHVLDFVSGASCSDDPASYSTRCTLSGGGGGGATPGGSSGNLQTNNGAGGFGAYAGASCSGTLKVSGVNASGSLTCGADVDTTGLPSDPTACASGQYVTDQNASGTLTCAQVGYSQISGTPTIPADLAGEPFVTSSATTNLSAERVITSGTNTAVDTSVSGQVKINLSGTHSDAFHSDSYSGVGTCGANNFVRGVNDNNVPTCNQPAFSNLSGAATDSQIPNTITVDLAATASALASDPALCGPGLYVTDLAASGSLTCTQVAFSQLSGTASDSQLANNYSGVGACGASTWVSTLNDNAAPTCTQPAFSSLSGSASMTQGGTGQSGISDDEIVVGTGVSTTARKTLPSCSNATTSKLLYNSGTNEFTCGSDQTGGGGGGSPGGSQGSLQIHSTVTAGQFAAFPGSSQCTNPNFAVGTDFDGEPICSSSAHGLWDSTWHSDVTGTPLAFDVVYRNGSSQWTRLGGNTSSTKQYLSSTGSGGVATAPVWAQPAFADLSGTATMAQGGTGVGVIADDQLIVGTGASTTAVKLLPDCDTPTTSKLLYDQTTNAFSCGTDQTGSGSAPTLLRVATDFSNNTVTFSNVTGLTLAVGSGVTLYFDCSFVLTSVGTTIAPQLSINGPTASAIDYGVTQATSSIAVHYAAQTGYDSNINPATGPGAVILPAHLNGNIVTTASGTFAVRLRSETAANVVTVKRGSFCVVHQ